MAESKEHKELKERACQYLLNQNYRLARMEKECGYYGVSDVWGVRFERLYTKIIEVKVSRADFNADKHKRHKAAYVPPAEEIYYICPSGLIQHDEVGDCHGLLWFNGNKIINKKKAPFLKCSLETKFRIMIDFLEANSDFERKMTLPIIKGNRE